MENTKALSLSKASEVSGIPKSTIWRALQSGDLSAEKLEAGQGSSYRIDPDELEKWRQARGDSTPAPETAEGGPGNSETLNSELLLQAHLEGLKVVQDALQVASAAQIKASSLEVDLALEREARARAERQVLAIAAELSSHRHVLAEQAESLAEERAKRRAIEARQEEVVSKQVQVPPEMLKLDTPTPGPGQGWGRRMRRWLGLKTG